MIDRAETDRRVDGLVDAFNNYPPGARQTVMLEWPDLFFATSRLVRYVEVSRKPRTPYPPLFHLPDWRGFWRDLRRALRRQP